MTTRNPDATERLAKVLQQHPGPIEDAATLIAAMAAAGLVLIWTPDPLEPRHRVFLDGEIVPAGTCVLDEDGDVEFLDDTADCDDYCDDDCTCSYDVRNGNRGPLVEVLIPDYASAVAADEAARARRVRA